MNWQLALSIGLLMGFIIGFAGGFGVRSLIFIRRYYVAPRGWFRDSAL